MVHGETLKQGGMSHLDFSMKVRPMGKVGNGWLYKSAVAILRRVVPLASLRTSFSKESDRVI